jgi:lipopolysaccharide/colanic/teichoic acid biosynthesis glycosyltransferase
MSDATVHDSADLHAPVVPPAPQPRAANRALDVSLGIVALIASTPILVGAAIALRVSRDRGPLLFRAMRVGERGRPIAVLKLRTMVDGPATGPGFTGSNDPRVTRVGRVLRRYKLDELPQLVNVLRGEMSLVGPRPEDPRYVDWSDPLHRFVYAARPGITGPSQIAFRHEERLLDVPGSERLYRTEVLPAKLALDADYLARRTVASDLRMLAATARALVARDRAG